MTVIGLRSILETLLLGTLASLPSLAVGRLLAKKGLVWEQPRVIVISLIVVLLFVLRTLLPETPVLLLAGFIGLGSPLLYSQALWFTYRLGRWWWIDKNEVKKE